MSRSLLHRLLLVATAAAGVAVAIWLREPLARSILEFAGWVDGLGGWAPWVYVGGFAVGIACLVPASPLLLAGGAIFGLARGTLYGFLGMAAGGLVAFLIARGVARRAVERRVASRPEFEAINRALQQGGIWPVVLVRMSPLAPAWILNYGLGVTKVRWTHYLAASVAIVPTVLVYVFYGQAVGDLARLGSGQVEQPGAWYFLLLAAGIGATVWVTAVLARRSRRILRQMTDDPSHDAPDEEST